MSSVLEFLRFIGSRGCIDAIESNIGPMNCSTESQALQIFLVEYHLKLKALLCPLRLEVFYYSSRFILSGLQTRGV